MAVVGKRGQVAGMAVGLMERAEMVVEVSPAEVESAGSVEVEDGDVDEAGEDGGGRSFWSRSWTQIAVLPVPEQVKPKGQHLSPHAGS